MDVGCNCGGSSTARRLPGHAEPDVAPEPGDWVFEHPNGSRRVFSGASARRKAHYEAHVTGGRAWKVEGGGGVS